MLDLDLDLKTDDLDLDLLLYAGLGLGLGFAGLVTSLVKGRLRVNLVVGFATAVAAAFQTVYK